MADGPAERPRSGATAVPGRAGIDNHAINVVRTIAALLVVIGHTRALFFVDYSSVGHTPLRSLFYVITALGHGAVIVFFVLSGFWVGGSVLRQFADRRFSATDYSVNRLTRLWLVLIPAVALTELCDRIGIGLYGSGAVYRGATIFNGVLPDRHHLGAGTALGNIGFMQSIHVPSLGTNTALWSLAYEFWFYTWFPLLLVAIFGSGTRRRLLWGAVFAASVVVTGGLVLAYFPLWLLGALVAWKADVIRATLLRMTPRLEKTLVLGAAAGTVLALIVARGLKLPDLEGAPLIGIASAILIAVLIPDLAPRRLGRGVLHGLSRYAHVSYSLYAIHLPIVALLAASIMHGRQWQPTPAHIAAGAAIVLVPVFAAILFGRLTEARTNDVRRAVLRLVRRERQPVAVPGPAA